MVVAFKKGGNMLQRLSSKLIKHGTVLLSTILDKLLGEFELFKHYEKTDKVSDVEGFSVHEDNLYLTKGNSSYVLISKGIKVKIPYWMADGRDIKQSIVAIHSLGLVADLDGLTFTTSSATFSGGVINGTLVPSDNTSQLSSFITILGSNILWDNVKVDMLGGKALRVIHVKQGSSYVTISNCEVCNIKNSRFCIGIFVDAKSVKEAKVIGCYIHHISVVTNGVIGDVDGVLRGVLVGSATDPVPTSSTVSSVLIKDIIAEHLSPFEDCDAVVIQIYDSNSQTLNAPNVRVIGVTTYNVLKRAVKVQANLVHVSGVNVYCDDKDSRPMYSAISLYGNNNSASNVYASGRVENGVDVAHGYNNVHNVILRSTASVEISAGVHMTGGQLNASNIDSEGANYVILIRAQLGEVPYVNISGIKGQGYMGGILFEMRNTQQNYKIGQVHLSNIAITSSNDTASSISVAIYNNQTINYIGIDNIVYMSQSYNGSDVNFAGGVLEAKVTNSRFNAGSSSVGVSMTTGKLLVDNITGNKVVNVWSQLTTGSRIFNVEGKVRLTDTTDTVICNLSTPEQQGTNTNLRQVSWV